MKKKIALTITLGFILLGLIISGFYFFQHELNRRLDLVSVPVSTSSLPPRHTITAQDLTWIDIPSAYLQADLLLSEASLSVVGHAWKAPFRAVPSFMKKWLKDLRK